MREEASPHCALAVRHHVSPRLDVQVLQNRPELSSNLLDVRPPVRQRVQYRRGIGERERRRAGVRVGLEDCSRDAPQLGGPVEQDETGAPTAPVSATISSNDPIPAPNAMPVRCCSISVSG